MGVFFHGLFLGALFSSIYRSSGRRGHPLPLHLRSSAGDGKSPIVRLMEIGVNYHIFIITTLRKRPNPGIMVHKRNHPIALFQAKYCHLPYPDL